MRVDDRSSPLLLPTAVLLLDAVDFVDLLLRTANPGYYTVRAAHTTACAAGSHHRAVLLPPHIRFLLPPPVRSAIPFLVNTG